MLLGFRLYWKCRMAVLTISLVTFQWTTRLENPALCTSAPCALLCSIWRSACFHTSFQPTKPQLKRSPFCSKMILKSALQCWSLHPQKYLQKWWKLGTQLTYHVEHWSSIVRMRLGLTCVQTVGNEFEGLMELANHVQVHIRTVQLEDRKKARGKLGRPRENPPKSRSEHSYPKSSNSKADAASDDAGDLSWRGQGSHRSPLLDVLQDHCANALHDLEVHRNSFIL